jgi:hypothetical protein
LPANLEYFYDTSALAPLSGDATSAAAVTLLGHSLYVLDPDVPIPYVDLTDGITIALSGGLASTPGIGYKKADGWTIPWFFSVTGSDGSTWSINLDDNTWQ